MRSTLGMLLASLFALLPVEPGFAEPPSAGGKPKPEITGVKDKPGSPEAGPIKFATKLVNSKVRIRDGKEQGQIRDLVLDLDNASVVLYLISVGGEKDGEIIAVPRAAVVLDPEGAPQLDLSSTQSENAPRYNGKGLPEKGTRRWAVSVYEHFKIDSDWRPKWPAQPQADAADAQATTTKSKEETVKEELLGEDHPLMLWSRLVATHVNSTKREGLGKVDDLAIVPQSGLIVYAALAGGELASDMLRPIPLSAFVVRPDKNDWLLELPEDVVANTLTIARGERPAKVDAGWVEYVHVRYGRSPFGGIRSALKGSTTRKE